MNERTSPLEIAFMGYNAQQTRLAFIQFARDNAEEIAEYSRTWCDYLKLQDGTRITGIAPERVRRGVDGYRFDQLILADDSRKKIHIDRGDEIDALIYGALAYSCVPEEYKILFYDLDAPEPRSETRKGAGKHEEEL